MHKGTILLHLTVNCVAGSSWLGHLLFVYSVSAVHGCYSCLRGVSEASQSVVAATAPPFV